MHASCERQLNPCVYLCSTSGRRPLTTCIRPTTSLSSLDEFARRHARYVVFLTSGTQTLHDLYVFLESLGKLKCPFSSLENLRKMTFLVQDLGKFGGFYDNGQTVNMQEGVGVGG